MFSNKRKTRSITKSKFGGSPIPLVNTEPPTHRQIIQELFFQTKINPSYSCNMIFKLITEKIIMV